MSIEYEIQSSELPLCYRGTMSQPAVRGVYLEELPDSVSGTSEISSERYSIIEDDLMNVDGISDPSYPFTHSYAAYVYVSEAGTYRFYVRANFGAEATIYDGENGVAVCVSCGSQAESSSVEEIRFAEPGYYKIEVKYCSTGEASPVLELHFGKKASDSASREELPQLRDFYIANAPYATLAGKGTELRPGRVNYIELQGLDGYTVYDGYVTVFTADDEVYYSCQLEGNSVWIPSLSAGNGDAYSANECYARIILHAAGGTCGCGGSVTLGIKATIAPENFREDSAPKCVCACSNSTNTADDCISFSQNIGRTPWASGTPVGQLFIEEDKPSAAMLTPAVLKYRHVMRRKLLNVSSTVSSGYIDVSDGCGETTRYDLATGSATGLSVTEESMLMSSGSEWVEQFSDRSQVIYDADGGEMIRYVTSGGIELGPYDFGINILEDDGQISQIYSVADGLMNITSESSAGASGSFQIDWYSPEAVLSSGTTGYVISAGANPVKSFLFSGTYQPALSGRDLRFHLTESRYGGTQTYYTGWEYSEEYDSANSAMVYQGWAMYKGSTPNTIQQTELRIITSGVSSPSNFHVSNVIVSGSCSLADYVSSGGTALYERNAEVNCGGLGNARVEEHIGSNSNWTERISRVSSGFGQGKTSSMENRYGGLTFYTYDSLSRLETVSAPDGYDTLYTSYTYFGSSSDGFPDYRPASIVSKYSSNSSSPVFKETIYSYQDNATVGRSETIIQSANGSALTTERVWYPVAGAVVSGGTRTTALNYSDGRLKTVRNEDGTMTSYSYGAVAVSGMPSSGTIFTESATEGYCSNGAFATLPGKSVRRVNSYNVCGDLVGQERFVCLSNGAFVSIGSDSFQYNLTHQRTSAVFANGQTSSASWNCTGPITEVSVDGVTTTYQYDGLKRCVGKVTSSPNGTITESYTLDYAGNIIQTTVSGGGLSLSSSAAYDQDGRIVSSIDPAGQTTTWHYDGYTTTSETHADSGVIVSSLTSAGLLSSIAGTAVTSKWTYYSVSDSATLQSREDHEGTGGHLNRIFTDGHGHVVRTETPSFEFSAIVSASQFYDTLGRHISTFVSGQPGLSKTYDAMGNPLAEILSGGTSIRATLTNTNFVSSAGVVYQVAVTSAFASNTASGTSTTPIVTSQVTRLYPLNNSIRSEQTTIDARGNSATTSESYNPTSQTHTFVRSYPGISNLESAVQRDGLLLSSVSILGGTTSFAYDGLHRQVAQTDPRGNVTSQVYNSYGQVASVIEPTGAVTTYGYDNMGRMTRVVNALGGTVSYTYNPRGQKLSESGNATYPVEYEYDDDTGKLSAHCLHRNSNTDDRTYYYYDSCTQLLKEKCDANGSSVRYEYNSNGLLSKRTWARTTSNGADLITSYTYNVFGELTSVSYNDTTPNVSFTRDALGREVGRSDGAGSQTTAYNAYGEVTTEKFPLSTNSSATVSRTYDSVGRPKTILLKGTTAAVYTYDAATGRYATVKNNSATVTYSYLDKTNLPLVQTWQKGTSSAFLTVSNTYDAYNRLTLINANSSNQAAYVYDSLGRRTSATLQDDTAWNYSYNQRSEITSAFRKNASNVTQNTMRYVFDNIGNRTSSYEDATSKTYNTDSLNQYTKVKVVGGSTVSPLYDNDGNMTQFGSSTYTYDAENRLISAVNGTKRVECGYDALSRRVFKKVYLNNSLSTHERYVYDGMKLLATYNARSSFAKINTFLWQPFGLDVPLIMTYNSTVYGYLVDANKNVLGLFNPSKTRVATYLYGPFGQKLSESGTIAANNPLQFSSEQFDADLNLVYYNFRYYFPAIGKWLTKDPIGEMGGWNLYAFCGNNAVNAWDTWGGIYENKSLNETNDPYLRFLSGLKYDEVYRAQHERERNNCQQNDSLDCGQDKNGVPILQVKDDAGKYCCPNKISIVEFRIRKVDFFDYGHAFLYYTIGDKKRAWGYYMEGESPFSSEKTEVIYKHPIQDEEKTKDHKIKQDNPLSWKYCFFYYACEETIETLDKIIRDDLSSYNLLNIGPNSYNCVGKAAKWLKDANFEPPYLHSMPAIPGRNLTDLVGGTCLVSILLGPVFFISSLPNIIYFYDYKRRNHDRIRYKNE